jgi:DNA-binding MarR family transcriptional regulator
MLRQSFTYQLASIAEDAVGPAARLFRNRFGLDVHELRVLRLIDDQPGVTFTSLARQTKFERSATSRILSRLIKAGLVRREIDEDDARQFRLHVTPKGRALRERADPLSLELEAMILSTLSAGERQDFRRILDKLSTWLNSEFEEELASRYPEAGQARRKRA